MKKYIISALLGSLFFSVTSYAKCCDCCQKENINKVNYLHVYENIDSAKTPVSIYSLARSMSVRNTGIKKLIGKMVHRTKPCGIDRSYIDEPRKLLAVTDEYLILSSDILARGQFEIVREIWDDGNWEAVTSKYYCVRCGKKLSCSTGDFNYFCTSCKTEFNIKEE